MATLEGSSRLRTVLHGAAPFAVLGYFLITTLWSIIMLHTDNATVRPRLKRAVVLLMSFVIMTFAVEAVVVMCQIYQGQGLFATHDANVYALSGVLVWAVLVGVAVGSEQHSWYPFCGAWIIAGCIDTAICAAEIAAGFKAEALEWVQVALECARIIGIALLLATVAAMKASKGSIEDEETKPLLGENPQANANATDGSYESTVRNRIDHQAAKRQKERERKRNNMKEKLRQDGNWFTYARRFLIFWPQLWPQNRKGLLLNMAGVAICLVSERGLNILGPRQLGILVNYLTFGLAGPSFGALGLYILFKWLNSSSGVPGFREALWIPVESNARTRLDKKGYNHIMELSCDFHDNKQDGELFAAMRQGSAITGLLRTILYDIAPLITDLVLALFYFWVLFDAYLVLIAAATMVIYFWSSLILSGYQMSMHRKLNAMYRQRYQSLYDTMSQWKTVVYLNRILHVQRLFAEITSVFYRTWRNVRYLSQVGSAAQSLILNAASFGALTYAVYQVVYGDKDLGSFMTLLAYWENFRGPLTYLSMTHLEVLNQLVDAEELRSLLERQPSVPDGSNEFQVDKAEVTLENVSFAYEVKGANIKNISLHASPGQTIALVGPTGAGKSTLIKLLFRLYDAKEGSIKIDGQDIRDVTLESLRSHIGVVPQEPSLFNDTIFNNLRYGKPDLTKEEAVEACKGAAIHDKIETFPDGYDSIVGERGVKLSGGERQRIAIARVILKNPKLILLDEATSAVDNETQEKIQAGLAKLCAGRTTFIIAHRLSTIRDADLIYVIKDGGIDEFGPPQELIDSKGSYYRMWSKEMGIVDAIPKEDGDGSEQNENQSIAGPSRGL